MHPYKYISLWDIVTANEHLTFTRMSLIFVDPHAGNGINAKPIIANIVLCLFFLKSKADSRINVSSSLIHPVLL